MAYSIHTQCVHAGSLKDPEGGVNTPLSLSSAYGYQDEHSVLYPRYYNTPNQRAVANKIAKLESAERGILFASGMGAISSIFIALLKSGDHLLITEAGYGGTEDLVRNELPRLGIQVDFCPQSTDAIKAALKPNTRMIYVETPSNPLLNLIDLAAVAQIAREQQCISVVDNTFATPIAQRPIELGFDISLHSATKYLGGHSDLSAGAVVGSAQHIEIIHTAAVRYGACLNALDVWLLERSLKTLAIRVERQSKVAHELADQLNNEKCIEKVYYPGLQSHPQHGLAERQMSNFGSMLSFQLATDVNPSRFEASLKLIRTAVSLGGVESILSRPCMTSHAKMSPSQREALGISDRLIRLSVGIEDPSDLYQDIQQAALAAK